MENYEELCSSDFLLGNYMDTMFRYSALDTTVVEWCRYMYNEVLSEEQRERTHIFNTFFYGQLMNENRDTSSALRFAL